VAAPDREAEAGVATTSERDEKRYKNYCKARAVSVWFIAIGAILVAGALAGAAGYGSSEPRVPVVVLALVMGLSGVVGGAAVRSDRPRLARVIKVMAWLYIWAFPVGTVLSLMLLDSLPGYTKYVESNRPGGAGGEDASGAEDTW
jgi:hypothetical protein